MITTSRIRHAKPAIGRGLPERRYLPELHGVRGLALVGVVLFHLFGNGRVSGGIDVFLAISGFLFTGMLLREAATSGGRIDLLKYFGRLVRRILAPAAIVVTTTLIAGIIISPVTKHVQLWTEARASLLYFENVELINSQLAYGAAGPETSPFQHFWSLSVQGQFYLLWPAIAIIAVLIAQRLRVSAIQVMTTLVGAVLLASFGYAIYVSSFNQDEAYLMTTTRMWQLAFGGLLALIVGATRLPVQYRAAAGWLGLTLIASTGFVLDGANQFPGPGALYPLAGLTLILISAGPKDSQGTKHTASKFLSTTPLKWIGDRAYGLYLWHWPLLIYYMELRGRDAIGWRGALVVLAITVALAVLTHRYVEQPLKERYGRRRGGSTSRMDRNALVVAAGFLLVAGTGASVILQQPPSTDAHDGWDWVNYPGASYILSQVSPPDVPPLPELAGISEHRPSYATTGCGQKRGNDPGTDVITVCAVIRHRPIPQPQLCLLAVLTLDIWKAHLKHWGNSTVGKC